MAALSRCSKTDAYSITSSAATSSVCGTVRPRILAVCALERIRRIGVITGIAVDDPETKLRLAAFLQEMRRLGWAEGRNIRLDYRSAAGNSADMRKYAAELAAVAPDVILAIRNATVAPLLQETRTVPIVFTIVVDSVGAAFVKSLARPGGTAS